MKRFFLALCLVLLGISSAWGDPPPPKSRTIPVFLVGTLPAASTLTGEMIELWDAADASTCTTGGGLYRNFCQSDGSIWHLIGSGGVSGVPSSRTISTTSPLTGGGTLATDLNFACPTCEFTGHKGQPSGYPPLDSGGLIPPAFLPPGPPITQLPNFTDNGFVLTTGGNGTLSVSATSTGYVNEWRASGYASLNALVAAAGSTIGRAIVDAPLSCTTRPCTTPPTLTLNFRGNGRLSCANATSTITALARSGTTVTVTTSAPHGYAVGESVYVTDLTPGLPATLAFGGWQTVVAAMVGGLDTKFTYTQTSQTETRTSAAGTVTSAVAIINGEIENSVAAPFAGCLPGAIVFSGTTQATPITPNMFGATGGTRVVTDGAFSATSNIITSATAAFTQQMADDHWLIDVQDSGASDMDLPNSVELAFNNQAGTITGFTDATTVTVSFTTITAGTGKQITFGPNETPMVLAAYQAARNVYIPPGRFAVSGVLSLPSNRNLYGAGQGVSILQQLGPARGVNNRTPGNLEPAVVKIEDGTQDVSISHLSILGTNVTGTRTAKTVVLHSATGSTFDKTWEGGTLTISGVTYAITSVDVANNSMWIHNSATSAAPPASGTWTLATPTTGPTGTYITTPAIGLLQLAWGFYMRSGIAGLIKNISLTDVELGQTWGMGARNTGDYGDQSGIASTVVNVRVQDSFIHHNADNGININTGGGLLIRHNTITYNGQAGSECGCSRTVYDSNYVAYNHHSGVSFGGLGDPSVGKLYVFTNNTVERNGNTTDALSLGAPGITIGGNVIDAVVTNNIFRENTGNGIQIIESSVEFSSLTQNILVANNQIISNGLYTAGVQKASSGYGILITQDNNSIFNNDIYDDGVSGYRQRFGMSILGNRNRIRGNNVHDAATADYQFLAALQTEFDTGKLNATYDITCPNSSPGTVDTSGTTVTRATGAYFNPDDMVGTTIRIGGTVRYNVTAVAARPTGTYTLQFIIHRDTGTALDAGWAPAGTLTIGSTTYTIAAVDTGANTMTLTNASGTVPATTGTWTITSGGTGTGHYDTRALGLHRNTGTNFNSLWVNGFVNLNDGTNVGGYYKVLTVTPTDDLTFQSTAGRVIPASGTWTMRGSDSLTVAVSPGTLTGAASCFPQHFLRSIDSKVASTLVAADFTLSAGWGSTATVTGVSGTDRRWRAIFTPNGTSIAANPTITLNYKDGAWSPAPISIITRAGGTGIGCSAFSWAVSSTTALVLTCNGTPIAGETYQLVGTN